MGFQDSSCNISVPRLAILAALVIEILRGKTDRQTDRQTEVKTLPLRITAAMWVIRLEHVYEYLDTG